MDGCFRLLGYLRARRVGRIIEQEGRLAGRSALATVASVDAARGGLLDQLAVLDTVGARVSLAEINN